MTFIASVVAKKGVAVIADSLVTLQMPILDPKVFYEHLEGQPSDKDGDVILNSSDVAKLFSVRPMYTKDFEEKLVRLNKYTAVTTTGSAYINDHSIADLVEIYCSGNIENEAPVLEIVSCFRKFISQQVRDHLTKYAYIGKCVFVVTHYQKDTHKTSICKITINEVDNTKLEDLTYDYTNEEFQQDWVKVVCDGQNKISENILYGVGIEIYKIFPEFLSNLFRVLNLPEYELTRSLFERIMEDDYFNDIFYGDLKLLNLTELSLQQAVDLASLLMRLEVDFQRYTKDIPTVGGQIKLAIIDGDGFKFISGHDIVLPKHLNL